jgi:hypothetical protein
MSSPFSENPYQTPQAPLEPPPYYPSPFRSPRNCTEAIAALVCANVGMFFCGIFPGCSFLIEPIALVLSIVALKKTRDDPNLKGRGMALAGMVISIVVLVLSILWLLLMASIFISAKGPK